MKAPPWAAVGTAPPWRQATPLGRPGPASNAAPRQRKGGSGGSIPPGRGVGNPPLTTVPRKEKEFFSAPEENRELEIGAAGNRHPGGWGWRRGPTTPPPIKLRDSSAPATDRGGGRVRGGLGGLQYQNTHCGLSQHRLQQRYGIRQRLAGAAWRSNNYVSPGPSSGGVCHVHVFVCAVFVDS